MNFSQSFRLALKSLMTSKMRALLTMLGIIIGVAAVIVITSLGNGMTQMMNDQFDQLGANLIQVQVWGRGEGSRTIEPDDMYALAEKYPKYIARVLTSISAPRSTASARPFMTPPAIRRLPVNPWHRDGFSAILMWNGFKTSVSLGIISIRRCSRGRGWGRI